MSDKDTVFFHKNKAFLVDDSNSARTKIKIKKKTAKKQGTSLPVR